MTTRTAARVPSLAPLLGLLAALLALLAPAVSAQVLPDPPSPGDAANAVERTLTASDYVLGIILIVAGLILAFFGRRLFKLILFLAGFVVVGFLVYYLCYKIRYPDATENTRRIVYLVVAIVLGIAGGFLCMCLWWLGLAAVGGLGGYALAIFILSLKDGGLIESSGGRWGLIAGLIVLGIVLVLCLEKPVLILATAIFGGYGFINGVDTFARTGFREASIAFVNGQTDVVYHTGPKVYAMIGGLAATALVGAIFQFVAFRNYNHRSGGPVFRRREKNYA